MSLPAMAFTQFPEQEKVVHLLQRSLDRGRVAHAYLFVGGGMTQLEAVSGVLAKSLNCLRPPARGFAGIGLDSCDECPSCRKIDHGNHADVQWLRPESKSRVITIDQIRALMQTINLKPLEAEWKVAVIVAAERLNIQAANAFLKTLEEPPAKSIVLLLSTEPERILETIASRCLRLNFGTAGRLKLEQAESEWLARFGEMAASYDKSLLSRYRLLSAILSKLAMIKEGIEQTLSAASPLSRNEEVDPHLREKWEDELAAAIEAEYRLRRTEVLLALEWWLRDVWLESLGVTRDLQTLPALGSTTGSIAKRMPSSEAVENLRILEDAHRLLGSNVQEALALEVGLLKIRL